MSDDALTRGQVAYRGFAQIAAWSLTVLMWVAPGVYAMNQWFQHQLIEGFYVGIGCFVVMKNLRGYMQAEADGRVFGCETDSAQR